MEKEKRPKEDQKRDIETMSVHSGRDIDESSGAVCPPINLSTTFERAEDGSYPKGYIYSRNSNPNRESLERCIAELEGGETAAAFSSGSAASMAVFQAFSPGDHIICPDDMYHGIKKQLDDILRRWDLKVSYVDLTDLGNLEDEIRENTEMIWIESPSNPLLKITDIEKVGRIAEKNDLLSVCDNTWPTPVLQKPLKLGCDLVVHSTTKYFGGHSDAVGGIVVSAEDNDFFERIEDIEIHGGATPSPFDCWLISRGLRTLPLRMKKHSENARKIAEFLNDHPEVKKVNYPGLKDHTGHSTAKKQMEDFGGMLSFQVKGGKDTAFKIASEVDIFTRATSLGSVESLIEHRSSIEGEGTSTPDDLLRLSVGIENSEDLIEDLKRAIDRSC